MAPRPPTARTAQHGRRGGVRGLERRRRRRQRRAGAPGRDLGSGSARRDRRRGVLRLPGQSPGRSGRSTVSTRELVWPTTRISHCRPPGADRDLVLMHGVEPNMRWRTFCAELLAIATSSTSTPWSSSARCWPTPRTPGRCRCRARPTRPDVGRAIRAGADPLRGPDRDRRRVPGRLRRGRHPGGDVLGSRTALRLAAAQPEGHAGAAAPRRGRARHRGAAGRPARAGRGVGAGGQRDDRRGRRDRRYVAPSSSAATPRWTCPRRWQDRRRRPGREFERYLRRRGPGFRA